MIKKKENPSASLLELLANKLVARTIGRRNKIELIDLFDRFIMVIPYVNNIFFEALSYFRTYAKDSTTQIYPY
tara:strand:- start:53 stop:271 length:219 start_codon:yes stop_codon:yes gene_type:complete